MPLRFLFFSQVLPSHSPREYKAANSHPCCQIENAIDTLRVSDQDTREISPGHNFPENCSTSINNTLTIDCGCVFGDESSKTVTKYSFRETEKCRSSKRLAEDDQCHGDGQDLRWHCILNCDNGLSRRTILLNAFLKYDREQQAYHLQPKTTTSTVEDLVSNPFACRGTSIEGSYKATPNRQQDHSEKGYRYVIAYPVDC